MYVYVNLHRFNTIIRYESQFFRSTTSTTWLDFYIRLDFQPHGVKISHDQKNNEHILKFLNYLAWCDAEQRYSFSSFTNV